MGRIILLASSLVAVWLAFFTPTSSVNACAFSVVPMAYEPPVSRNAHLRAMELAGYNMIAPGNGYFGIDGVEAGLRGGRHADPNPYVPPTLLKSIGYIESGIRQTTSSATYNAPHFGGVGPALESFDCGYGIMQITTGMTEPLDNGWPLQRQSLVATDYLHNVARGSAILVEKWNGAPEVRPIAGTDNHSDPRIVENWYFATWGYNGFTGPFSSGRSNHPASPSYDWPRTGFSCGPLNDGFGHSYGDYPYQELVFGCARRPPSVNGAQLWSSLPLSLPNLENALWGRPLSLQTWDDCVGSPTASCPNFNLMDMPSPSPNHTDPVARPPSSAIDNARGSPVLDVSHTHVNQWDKTITIRNVGSGTLPWRADHDEQWFAINKQAGVALSPGVTCTTGVPCPRDATLRITISQQLAPRDGSYGFVNIISLKTGQSWQVAVVPPGTSSGPTPTRPPTSTRVPTNTPPPAPPTPSGEFPAGDADCSRSVNSIDASRILQFGAGLVPRVPCPGAADVNRDAFINVLDATIILQFVSGLISGIPP